MERELDYLASALTRVEEQMIDPQEFGELKAEVAAQRRDLDRLTGVMERFADTQSDMLETLNAAKGGWRTLMAVGGISGAIGSGISWLASHWKP